MMSRLFIMGVKHHIGAKNRLQQLNPFIDWQPGRSLLKGIHKNAINPQGASKAYDNLAGFKSNDTA